MCVVDHREGRHHPVTFHHLTINFHSPSAAKIPPSLTHWSLMWRPTSCPNCFHPLKHTVLRPKFSSAWTLGQCSPLTFGNFRQSRAPMHTFTNNSRLHPISKKHPYSSHRAIRSFHMHISAIQKIGFFERVSELALTLPLPSHRPYVCMVLLRDDTLRFRVWMFWPESPQGWLAVSNMTALYHTYMFWVYLAKIIRSFPPIPFHPLEFQTKIIRSMRALRKHIHKHFGFPSSTIVFRVKISAAGGRYGSVLRAI